MKTKVLEKRVTNAALDRYLASLPNAERIAKTRDIREALNVTSDVVSDWRRGRSELKPDSFDKISEVLGVDLQPYIEN